MAYADIVGRWITGPMATGGIPPRVPQPIDWPRGEDGVISLRIIDQNDQPVKLNLAGGDVATFSFGPNFSFGSLVDVTATQGQDPEQFLFTITSATTKLYSGPQVYEVRVTKGGLIQQVAGPSYFTLGPKVVST